MLFIYLLLIMYYLKKKTIRIFRRIKGLSIIYHNVSFCGWQLQPTYSAFAMDQKNKSYSFITIFY